LSALLVIGAALAVLLAAAHSYLGERYILTRLFRREGLPRLFGGTEFTKRTLRFAWHLTGVAWVGLAAVLVALASADRDTGQGVAEVVSATFGLSGLVTLIGSRGRHLAWVVFLTVAALVWFGSR
jgi:hypothetical protein